MDNKRILVVYYSRTGTTKKIAQEIAENIGCDIEELYDLKNRRGNIGYIKSGREAVKKSVTLINQIENDPSHYDTIIIGTPIWASTMSSPVRTYIMNSKEKFKSLAFFTTSGWPADDKVFNEFRKITGKKPVATLSLSGKEIKKLQYNNKLKMFIDDISSF